MAEDRFNLHLMREKFAAGDNSNDNAKVFNANYSSLTYKEKKTWVIAAAIIREMRRLLEASAKRQERLRRSRPFFYLNDEEKRMMREDAVWEEVAHGCENEENEEPEILELNDLFLSD